MAPTTATEEKTGRDTDLSSDWARFCAKLERSGIYHESSTERYQLKEDFSKDGSLTSVALYADTEEGRDVILRQIDFLRVDPSLPGDVLEAKVNQADKLFKRQAKVLPKIKHSNLADVEGFFVNGAGEFYIKREYVEGKTLQELLDEGVRFSEPEVKKIMLDIAAGVAQIHKYQTIHRDIKPSNVVINCDGRAVVTDFDLLSDGIQMNGGSTCLMDGFTEGYTPPEAIAKMYLPQYDVYSLGVLGIHLTTGRSPVIGGKINTLRGGSPWFNFRKYCRISEGFAGILEKMVEADHGSRPKNMKAVTKMLDGVESNYEKDSPKAGNPGKPSIISDVIRRVKGMFAFPPPIDPHPLPLELLATILVSSAGLVGLFISITMLHLR